MSFFAAFNHYDEGHQPVPPSELDSSLQRTWDQTGPVDVNWPLAASA